MKRQVKVSVGRSAGYSVSESAGELVISGTTTAGTGLLDVHTGAAVAYSTARRLRDDYAGPLLRVRRSSDNAEQDIGFVAGTGLLDTAALSTFVGANDGLVITLYDQSGNGRDATQATATRQPVLVSAGVLVTLGTNSRPAIQVVRAATQFVESSAFLPGTSISAASIFAALNRTDEAAISVMVAFGNAATGGDNGSLVLQGPTSIGATDLGMRVRGASTPPVVALTSITAATAYVLGGVTILGNTGGQGFRQLRNGVSTTISSSASLSGNTFGTWPFTVGAGKSGATPASGVIGDVIFYPTSARASASSVIDTDLKTFWGIT